MEPALALNHPCYSEGAQHHFARIHAAVAFKCNISCHYCNRKFDCANESRPGVTSKLLKPEEAIAQLGDAMDRLPNLTVLGIAGPGDPLANPEETFRPLRLAKEAYPDLHLCLSTNGLMLPEYAGAIIELGIKHVTVTMNAVNAAIGAKLF